MSLELNPLDPNVGTELSTSLPNDIDDCDPKFCGVRMFLAGFESTNDEMLLDSLRLVCFPFEGLVR